MRCLLLLALAATAVLLSPCHYTFEIPGVGNRPAQPLEFDHLDSSVINRFFTHVRQYNPTIDLRSVDVIFQAVCNIGPQWDYHIYKVRKDTQLAVVSEILSTATTIVTPKQREFLKTEQYVHLDIMILNWGVGKSTLKTVSLSKDPDNEKVYLIDGSRRFYERMNILLSGQVPEEYLDVRTTEPPIDKLRYRFPIDYECIFSNKALGVSYLMYTTGKMCLVQSKLNMESWQTLNVLEEYESIFHRDDIVPLEAREVNHEMRVYVRTKETAVSSLNWAQGKLEYSMITVTKPRNDLQKVDMSGFEIVSTPVPTQPQTSKLLKDLRSRQ